MQSSFEQLLRPPLISRQAHLLHHSATHVSPIKHSSPICWQITSPMTRCGFFASLKNPLAHCCRIRRSMICIRTSQTTLPSCILDIHRCAAYVSLLWTRRCERAISELKVRLWGQPFVEALPMVRKRLVQGFGRAMYWYGGYEGECSAWARCSVLVQDYWVSPFVKS